MLFWLLLMAVQPAENGKGTGRKGYSDEVAHVLPIADTPTLLILLGGRRLIDKIEPITLPKIDGEGHAVGVPALTITFMLTMGEERSGMIPPSHTEAADEIRQDIVFYSANKNRLHDIGGPIHQDRHMMRSRINRVLGELSLENPVATPPPATFDIAEK